MLFLKLDLHTQKEIHVFGKQQVRKVRYPNGKKEGMARFIEAIPVINRN